MVQYEYFSCEGRREAAAACRHILTDVHTGSSTVFSYAFKFFYSIHSFTLLQILYALKCVKVCPQRSISIHSNLGSVESTHIEICCVIIKHPCCIFFFDHASGVALWWSVSSSLWSRDRNKYISTTIGFMIPWGWILLNLVIPWLFLFSPPGWHFSFFSKMPWQVLDKLQRNLVQIFMFLFLQQWLSKWSLWNNAKGFKLSWYKSLFLFFFYKRLHNNS